MMTSQFKTHSLRGTRRRTTPRARLAVEALESRWVPSQVTNSLGLAALKGLHAQPPASGGHITDTAGPSFQVISQPDATYQASTSKLNITAPDFTPVASLTDGTETATFNPQGTAGTVPGGGWASWSSPPDAESSTPRVLTFINASSETIQLSVPAATFGVEVEPNLFTPAFTVTATFADAGGNVLGTISRDVLGQSGARLFAGTDLTGVGISSVTISIDPSAQGFAVAQVRYALNQSTGPIVIGSTPQGTVSGSVDHVTVTFNEPTDTTTFTPDEISLTDPNGNPVTITQDNIVPNDNGSAYTISFDPQTTLGQYSLSVGPDIADLSGNPMGYIFSSSFTISNELIVNGGFETGNFSGWTTNIRSATSVGTINPAHSGRFAVDLGAVGSDDTFWQDVPTTPGTMYHISFWYFRDGGTPSDFNVSWNGVNIYSEVNSPAHGYEQHTFDLMAGPGTTTQLLFGGRNDPTYDSLDDVSVMADAAPGINPGHRVGDATLASSLVTPATVRVSPAAVAPATLTTDQPAATLDQYFAAPATSQSPAATATLRPAPANPVHDPLDLVSLVDSWTL